MERKKFIASILATGAVLKTMGKDARSADTTPDIIKIPAYLRQGSVIGISCPAGYISIEDTQPAIKKLEEWGFRVKVGATVGKKDHTNAGTDEERAADLENLLNDDSVHAILCARGGYGTVRIIDQIDFKRFTKRPK